ncbi:MAG: RidA family protein [Gammaproteobacteria bacterium]
MRRLLCLAVVLAMTACNEHDSDDAFRFTRINPDTLNKHPYYSQATVVSGNARFVYVAGQTDRAVDYKIGSNECRHDDWRGQVMGVRENVGKALRAAGASWDDVVFIRRFVVDMVGFRKVLADHDNPLPAVWQKRRPPPSTLIEVSKLSEPCQLLEIDVFAAVPARD